jgi:hypothetical protein
MDSQYDDLAFDKLLSDNRDRYIQQSRNTRCGRVAELPTREERIEVTKRPEQYVWVRETNLWYSLPDASSS